MAQAIISITWFITTYSNMLWSTNAQKIHRTKWHVKAHTHTQHTHLKVQSTKHAGQTTRANDLGIFSIKQADKEEKRRPQKDLRNITYCNVCTPLIFLNMDLVRSWFNKYKRKQETIKKFWTMTAYILILILVNSF